MKKLGIQLNSLNLAFYYFTNLKIMAAEPTFGFPSSVDVKVVSTFDSAKIKI